MHSVLNKKILFIEICNYTDYPLGGHLTFAKNLLRSFGNQLVLVGCTADDTPVGVWLKKEIDGVIYDFFSVKKIKNTSFNKPIIPPRLSDFIAVRKYRKKIFSYEVDNVIIQTPEVLLATKKYWKTKNTALFFPGIENPLSFARYSYAKYIASAYEKYFFITIKDIKPIFACADDDAIVRLCIRSKGVLKKENIISFPTRVNQNIFYKSVSKKALRPSLNIPEDEIVIVTSGRLHWEKGWDFLINSFEILLQDNPLAHLYFLGDGNERNIILKYISEKFLNEKVTLVGHLNQSELGDFLRIADLFVMGSYVEGFSTSLIEAVISGVPACVTHFSSATTLVQDGFNGYVCKNRDENEFALLMKKGLVISDEDLIQSSNEALIYSMDLLKGDMLNNWSLI